MHNKVHCRNMNHGKSNPGVAFCPNCGEKFNGAQRPSPCTVEKHQERRKSGSTYCYDCGKKLKDI